MDVGEVHALWRTSAPQVQGSFFEFVIRAAIFRYATPGSTAIDAGADGGAHTIHMAKAVGPTGKVIAFEPNPDMAAHIRRLCTEFSCVEVAEVALSDRTGTAPFHIATQSALSSLHQRPHQHAVTLRTIDRPLRRLDDVIPDEARVSLIKADVEGEELAMLRGAHETLRRRRPLVLIEIDLTVSFAVDWLTGTHDQEAFAEFMQSLDRLGYVPTDFFGRTITALEADAWNMALVPREMSGPGFSEFLLATSQRFFDEGAAWRLY
jgi:FkbM family methyltransferase